MARDPIKEWFYQIRIGFDKNYETRDTGGRLLLIILVNIGYLKWDPSLALYTSGYDIPHGNSFKIIIMVVPKNWNPQTFFAKTKRMFWADFAILGTGCTKTIAILNHRQGMRCIPCLPTGPINFRYIS